MTTISPRRKLVTFINVFTVEPTNPQQLVELLARVTETSVRHAPGCISASLHRSLDGTKVTMYAQWRSVEDYQAMREGPAPLPYLQQALAIAKFEGIGNINTLFPFRPRRPRSGQPTPRPPPASLLARVGLVEFRMARRRDSGVDENRLEARTRGARAARSEAR
jgi:quinol monooxygenase YgiN